METSDAEVIKCLLNPVRQNLFMELQLGRDPMRVSHLAEAVGKPVNSVSYHLSELENKGLVTRVKPEPGQDSRETRYAMVEGGLSIAFEKQPPESGALVTAVAQLLNFAPEPVARYRHRAMMNMKQLSDRMQFTQTVLRLTAEQEAEFHSALSDAFRKATDQTAANTAESREGLRDSYVKLEYFPMLADDDALEDQPQVN